MVQTVQQFHLIKSTCNEFCSVQQCWKRVAPKFGVRSAVTSYSLGRLVTGQYFESILHKMSFDMLDMGNSWYSAHKYPPLALTTDGIGKSGHFKATSWLNINGKSKQQEG